MSDRPITPLPGPLRAAVRLGSDAAGFALRPAAGLARAAGQAAGDAAGRAVLAGLDAVLASPVADEAVRKVLASPVLEHALSSPEAEQVVGRVLEGRLLDAAIDGLLESDELWELVDVVAASPSVTAAISQQGVGFAEQVGGEIRKRTRRADDWLEHRTRRVLHRNGGQDAGVSAEGG